VVVWLWLVRVAYEWRSLASVAVLHWEAACSPFPLLSGRAPLLLRTNNRCCVTRVC